LKEYKISLLQNEKFYDSTMKKILRDIW